MMAEFSATILGSGSALPMHGRHPSAQVITYGTTQILIDCGEGTQIRMRDFNIRPFRISLVLISHLHGDHFFGLPGLISTMSHLGRTEPLHIFGPVGLKPLLNSILEHCAVKINFPLTLSEHTATGKYRVWEDTSLEVSAFPLYHRIDCNGFLIREKMSSQKFDKDKIARHQLTSSDMQAIIRHGMIIKNEGKLHAAELMAKEMSPRSYAYCSDTMYNRQILPFIKGASMVYHESTFLHELQEKAVETGHSTASEAGMIARDAGAEALLLGHYSSRYKDVEPMKAEAEQWFSNTILSVEGERYRIG